LREERRREKRRKEQSITWKPKKNGPEHEQNIIDFLGEPQEFNCRRLKPVDGSKSIVNYPLSTVN